MTSSVETKAQSHYEVLSCQFFVSFTLGIRLMLYPLGLLSVTGKQVVEVPCANIGNFENVIAICHRGVEIQKVNILICVIYC